MMGFCVGESETAHMSLEKIVDDAIAQACIMKVYNE